METSKLVKCKACDKEIAQEASSCPHCGAWNFSKVNIIAAVAIAILVIFFLSGGFGGCLVP